MSEQMIADIQARYGKITLPPSRTFAQRQEILEDIQDLLSELIILRKEMDEARKVVRAAEYVPCTEWSEDAGVFVWISDEHKALYDAGVNYRIACVSAAALSNPEEPEHLVIEVDGSTAWPGVTCPDTPLHIKDTEWVGMPPEAPKVMLEVRSETQEDVQDE